MVYAPVAVVTYKTYSEYVQISVMPVKIKADQSFRIDVEAGSRSNYLHLDVPLSMSVTDIFFYL